MVSHGWGWAALAVFLLSGCMDPVEPLLSEDFEATPAGALPSTIRAAVGDWAVQAAATATSGDQVLFQGSMRLSNTYALATVDVPADLRATVDVQVASGTTEREAGLALRYRSPDETYVFNIDANEGGVRFTRVHEGIRDDIYKDRTTKFYPNQWYALELHADGSTFTGFVDGRPVFQVSDPTHADGRVGLWTRADTTARFDDLVVRP
ncbi:MAG TPA: family 16 glycoside hydrolase [Candidatus Thermoplasmatota archaeon]|nr:family 16 glycoside hydrolase [Candidatus Thermoplasmatota archaeon]